MRALGLCRAHADGAESTGWVTHIDKTAAPVKMPAHFGITGWMCVNKKPPVTEPASKRGRKVKPETVVKTTREPSATSLKRRMRLMEGKRTLILDAALEIFSRYGVHGSSLDQVASLADVSKTNLLYYFSSKDDLYLNVLRQLLEVWLSPLVHFTADKEPVQAIGAYIKAKLEMSRDHPAESRLFCMEVMQGAPLIQGELQHPLRDTVQAKVAVIQHWIDNGQLAPINPHHLIFTLWATTQHYADFRTQVEAVTGKTLDDPAFFEEVLASLRSMILDGILPRTA
ncbi:Regulatory protein, TetR [Pseudomonas amygdali pv. eriobotryae]|uniref:Regulatory protein, TetR n=2 Tax=Pseudomonas amygdali pv. eriobotryae TaxID=129137 RepID=A0A3M3ABH7_PSEA0|nr:Regulatory protein, TetR [Pseudomonas amygdali pv. eriobotryae]RMO53642.1 Regulatory protein, TetR [Pseudomonas amygdali pv. eriobotryae]